MKRVLIGLAIATMTASAASAGSVVVNGYVLDREERRMLANYSCGPIRKGSYWLNMNTGYWGYAGSATVQGHIRDRCRNRATNRRPSLSERGLLFRPGELVSD